MCSGLPSFLHKTVSERHHLSLVQCRHLHSEGTFLDLLVEGLLVSSEII